MDINQTYTNMLKARWHKMTYNDAQQAFENAIAKGKLSTKKTADNYAGNYMYMGTTPSGFDRFKNIETRLYDVECLQAGGLI